MDEASKAIRKGDRESVRAKVREYLRLYRADVENLR